ncbi:MAG: pilus assembly protein TadG-related protein [Neorhizobium sp.]|nr:pilus assembly protein TadG-related protein [Neorhizobium sp.]
MVRQAFARLVSDRGGNFAIMTAIALPVLLGIGGVAVDLSNAMQMKSDLQGIADAAALAAASSMAQNGTSATDAQTLAKNYLTAQLLSNTNVTDLTTAQQQAQKDAVQKATIVLASTSSTSSSSKGYEVKLNTSYTFNLNPITRLLGSSTMTLNIASTASAASQSSTGISMYLALDRSGSMSFVTSDKNPLKSSCDNFTSDSWPNSAFSKPCYIRKIEALQTAATSMFTSLNNADPKGTMVRVGAASYTDVTQTPSPISWGTTNAASYINALPYKPTGGTDATGAMTLAYNALRTANTTEASAQTAKGNTSFNRFIVLMTDGEMTGYSASWNSSLDKTVRGQCDTAKADGIKIFTIAFMAPDRGKSLLSYCASSSDYYYEPDDMSDLVAAFGDIASKAAKTAVRLTN